MIPAYLILISIAITFYTFFFRLEHDWLEKAGLIAGVVATVVAVIAIKFFIGVLTKYGFKPWGWYRIIVGIVLLIYFTQFA